MTGFTNSPLDVVSATGGSELITIAANAGQGADQPCREVYIIGNSANTGNCRVEIGDACGATEGIPVPGLGTHHFILRIPVANTNLLYFYGSVNGDTISLLFRQ
jgi:hypothetical protein